MKYIALFVLFIFGGCDRRTDSTSVAVKDLRDFGKAVLSLESEIGGVESMSCQELHSALSGSNPKGIVFFDFSGVPVVAKSGQFAYQQRWFNIGVNSQSVYIILAEDIASSKVSIKAEVIVVHRD